MPFSAFLDAARPDCRALVAALGEYFPYVSILGSDVSETRYLVDRSSNSVTDAGRDRGFVVKMHDGKSFFEYSLDDISGDKAALARRIRDAVAVDPALVSAMIESRPVADEPMRKDFVRESDFAAYSDDTLLAACASVRDAILSADEQILNAGVVLMPYSVSKLFITKNRELSQHYGWVNGMLQVVYQQNGRIVAPRASAYSHLLSDVLAALPTRVAPLVEKARHLAGAMPIEPGIYDVITDPSITGLIAHEAFGHGVEMDQFVKDRALAKSYVGRSVASSITNMRDGASAAFSVASYFFDDDGVLAHDTQIIRNGILVDGLSDLISAS